MGYRKHLLRSGCQSNTFGSFLRRNKPICGMVGDKRPGGLEQAPLCYGLLPIGIFAIMFARFHFYLAKLTLASNASAKVHLAHCWSLWFCIRFFESCGFLYFKFFWFVAVLLLCLLKVIPKKFEFKGTLSGAYLARVLWVL